MIRMLPGTWLRIKAIKKFENAVTTVSAIHITMVTFKLLVTARAEQTPKICNAIGLFVKIGPNKISRVFDMVMPLLL